MAPVIAQAEMTGDVARNLAKAWEFLSGERRMFDVFHPETHDHPPFAEFSMFMPLGLRAEARTAGVGVLIQREDASIVASHMFGLERGYLSEDDLRDACAEVCNVFSGCVSAQLSDQDVAIGLPSRVSASDFKNIARGSVLMLTYRSGQEIRKLFVLVYGTFLVKTYSH